MRAGAYTGGAKLELTGFAFAATMSSPDVVNTSRLACTSTLGLPRE